MNKKELINAIESMKQQHNAIILAHNYQLPEVQDIADIVGDSLMLSREAANTSANVIVFCGVHFMAESAKILSPDKTVLLPVLDAGCPMADMITVVALKTFKMSYPNVPIVCYVNSSAAVKAECDVTCTSSNARAVIESLAVSRVLFAPDRNLGQFINSQLPNVEVICYQGYCPVHEKVEATEIVNIKKQHPNVKVLLHPECNPNVLAHADFIGSTSQIINYVNQSPDPAFIIGTELGILHSLSRANPTKTFYPVASDFVCADMKKITLQDVFIALRDQQHVITIDEDTSAAAHQALDRMIKID